mmetsp:Transcript_19862/g.27986  ORF Transcript_19862/g.27986 Transcript_19862/m.27986 type:complete len:270 (-) Transcript_19862:396-1205(-)
MTCGFQAWLQDISDEITQHIVEAQHIALLSALQVLLPVDLQQPFGAQQGFKNVACNVVDDAGNIDAPHVIMRSTAFDEVRKVVLRWQKARCFGPQQPEKKRKRPLLQRAGDGCPGLHQLALLTTMLVAVLDATDPAHHLRCQRLDPPKETRHRLAVQGQGLSRRDRGLQEAFGYVHITGKFLLVETDWILAHVVGHASWIFHVHVVVIANLELLLSNVQDFLQLRRHPGPGLGLLVHRPIAISYSQLVVVSDNRGEDIDFQRALCICPM